MRIKTICSLQTRKAMACAMYETAPTSLEWKLQLAVRLTREKIWYAAPDWTFSVLWIFKICCRSFSPNWSQITLLLLSIGHVRYINILTRLQGFQKKFLHLVLFFFVFKSLKEIERQKKLNWQFTILTRKPRSHVGILKCWALAYCCLSEINEYRKW